MLGLLPGADIDPAGGWAVEVAEGKKLLFAAALALSCSHSMKETFGCSWKETLLRDLLQDNKKQGVQHRMRTCSCHRMYSLHKLDEVILLSQDEDMLL
jgi:hypothetical protein